MIGVVLTAGAGSRLKPVTDVVNKSVLPVGRYPMIAYPLWTLMASGVKEIVVVLNRSSSQQIKESIKSLNLKGISFSFVFQDKATGIPSAIGESEKYVKGKSTMVLMGDSVHGGVYKKHRQNFKNGMLAFLHEVDEPKRFAVPIYRKDGKLVDIVEKPTQYGGKEAVCGPLFFDKSVFSKIKNLGFSSRKETELVDLYKTYMKEEGFRLEKADDFLADVGTFESLAKTSLEIIENRVKFDHDYLKNAS